MHSASLFNHSCVTAQCSSRTCSASTAPTATRDCPFIAYVGGDAEVQAVKRQHRLSIQYGFICRCDSASVLRCLVYLGGKLKIPDAMLARNGSICDNYCSITLRRSR